MNGMDWFEQLALSGVLGATEAALLLIAAFVFVCAGFALFLWAITLHSKLHECEGEERWAGSPDPTHKVIVCKHCGRLL